MSENLERCVHCARSSEEIPLVRLHYRGSDYWICPQGIPILIHHPEQLEALRGTWMYGGVPPDHD